MHDVAIIGGGIVGLSVGYAILRRAPKTSVLVLEKEARCGHHQTGHNSGEIHSGIYYAPRSLKATLCREGNRSMVAFCRQYGIAHDVCGKVVVAVEESELPALTRLRQRAQENGIPVIKVPREMLRYIEPHCAGIAALHVPTTGIVDYQKVAEQLAELIRKHDGEVRLRSEAREVALADDGLRIETPSGTVAARFAINCGGLHSDRIAAAMGVRTGMRIVPIRGTYYRVAEPKRHLVRTLIYPVPNPRYPFLGVHLNRHLDGSLRVGPNALMCFKREGYRSGEVSVRDAAELLCSRAVWRFALAHWREAGRELLHAWSTRMFIRRVQRLIPEIERGDLIRSSTGVRAQAVMDDGRVIDDFMILSGPRSLHVCNAPSPAATASLPIGEYVAARAAEAGALS